jgi:hypothetical protein
MKHKISELTGPLLDYATGLAAGLDITGPANAKWGIGLRDETGIVRTYNWSPSTVANHLEPIAEKSRVSAVHGYGRVHIWYAWAVGEDGRVQADGPTRLIAQCRAICAAKWGEYFEDDVCSAETVK